MHEHRGRVTAASYAVRTHACAALTDTPFEARVRSRLLLEGTVTGNSEREGVSRQVVPGGSRGRSEAA